MPNGDSNSERLDSWKEIAAYLNHDVRTTMRWEKNRGLPVHRIPGGQRQAVFAYRTEISQWLEGMSSAGDAETPEVLPISPLSPELGPTPTIPDTPLKASAWQKISVRIVLGAAACTLLLGIAMSSKPFHLGSRRVDAGRVTQLTNNGIVKDALVTDGSQLYFSENTGAKISLASMPAAGGDVRLIETPFTNIIPLDISPNGRELLVRVSEGYDGRVEDQELWIVSVTGNSSRPVGTIRVHEAIWAPNGRAIAYSTANEIRITLDEGRSNRLLGAFDNVPTALQWAADGQHLLALLRHTRTSELKPDAYELSLDQNFKVVSSRAFHLPSDEYWGWSSAKATGTLFVSTGSPKENRFWRISDKTNPSSQAMELATILGGVSAIAASPEGKRLFVLSNSPAHLDLMRLDLSTQTFQPFLPGVPAIYVDFSRDGQRITYVKEPEKTLWVSNVDGGNPINLTLPGEAVMLPRWSPDGKQIAFSQQQRSGSWRIFIVPSNGGPTREASSGSNSQGAPTWSPDGRFLVYGSVDCQQSQSCAIHQIELATGKDGVLPGSEGLQTARWSPDGRYIAAFQQPDHIVLFDVQRNKWEMLPHLANGNDLNWSRNSRYLYTQSSDAHATQLIRMSVDSRTRAKKAQAISITAFTGQLSAWFALAPDDSVILLRDQAPGEIYRIDVAQD